jgi:hypothetical protein
MRMSNPLGGKGRARPSHRRPHAKGAWLTALNTVRGRGSYVIIINCLSTDAKWFQCKPPLRFRAQGGRTLCLEASCSPRWRCRLRGTTNALCLRAEGC